MTSPLRRKLLWIAASNAAFAASGKKQAEQLCQSLGWASEIQKCMVMVSKGRHYDKKAVQMCNAMGFASEKY